MVSYHPDVPARTYRHLVEDRPKVGPQQDRIGETVRNR